MQHKKVTHFNIIEIIFFNLKCNTSSTIGGKITCPLGEPLSVTSCLARQRSDSEEVCWDEIR